MGKVDRTAKAGMASPADGAGRASAARGRPGRKVAARSDADDMARDHAKAETLQAFSEAVNMTPAKLRKWLETDESNQVGITYAGHSESVGHRSGRRIVELLQKKNSELDDSDLAHMRKVVGYIRRHSAQRPSGDVSQTRWRWSLMNWGHDPLKDG